MAGAVPSPTPTSSRSPFCAYPVSSTAIPIVFPIVKALGYDPIWFGVIVTMLVEIAMISPPDGTVLYVLQGMRRQPGPITDVFSGVMPFLLMYVFAVIVLMVFPAIALWLPARLM